GIWKEVACVEDVVAQELVRSPVQRVRSRARCNIDMSSSNAKARRSDVSLDIEFLNGIHRGPDAEVLKERLVVVRAIQREIVLVGPVPAHCHRSSERSND